MGKDITGSWITSSISYLESADLQKDLDQIGFNLVGYGCTTCIGNSGPLQPEISKAISDGDLVATSVLSETEILKAEYLQM